MPKPRKFRTKRGLFTAYALVCGYVEPGYSSDWMKLPTCVTPRVHTQLIYNHGVYEVSVRKDGISQRPAQTFHTLALARKYAAHLRRNPGPLGDLVARIEMGLSLNP